MEKVIKIGEIRKKIVSEHKKRSLDAQACHAVIEKCLFFIEMSEMSELNELKKTMRKTLSSLKQIGTNVKK